MRSTVRFLVVFLAFAGPGCASGGGGDVPAAGPDEREEGPAPPAPRDDGSGDEQPESRAILEERVTVRGRGDAALAGGDHRAALAAPGCALEEPVRLVRASAFRHRDRFGV